MLFAAAQLADLLWPILLAIGVEQVRIDPGNTAVTPLDFVSYPTHTRCWRSSSGACCSPGDTACWPGTGGAPSCHLRLVVSHWVLDYLTHRPDMPLYPGSAKFGLGLWNSIPLTIAIEVAMFGAGVWVYLRATRARDNAGRWGFFALAAFLPLVYFINLFGPPPPSLPALYWSVMIGFGILLMWSWWADQHRKSVEED